MAGRRRLPFRIPFFRIFYSTTYTSLFFIVLILLAITPATLIYTAIVAKAYQYIFMVGGVYVLTALLTLFLYSSRLYTNRSVLAGVGKSYIPVEDGEVGRKVRKLIVSALESSAIIAWETRPKDLSKHALHDKEEGEQNTETSGLMLGQEDTIAVAGKAVEIDPLDPPWGHIQHPGWSSPSELETLTSPHIYYMTVIQELPNLIEARAVSLVTSNELRDSRVSSVSATAQETMLARVQRPAILGLRAYLTELENSGYITTSDSCEVFMELYEYARFSGRSLTEAEFTTLMAAFADFLDGMQKSSSPLSRSPQSSDRGIPSGEGSPISSAASSILEDSQSSAMRHPISTARLPSFRHIQAQTMVHTSAPPVYASASVTRSGPRELPGRDSMDSVVRRPSPYQRSSFASSRSSGLQSAGSVIRHTPTPGPGQRQSEWARDGG